MKPNDVRSVERRVISSLLRERRVRRIFFGAGCWLATSAVMLRAEIVPIAAPSFETGGVAKVEKAALDELVYKDGDRVRGHFVKRDGDTLVFQSPRFGLLRVPADGAEVILATKEPKAEAVAAAVKKDDKAEATVERWPFAPLAMAAALKDFFGNWHGRFALAAEMMQDEAMHESGTLEGHLKRKWTKDEVELNGRYDYASVDELTSTDMVKADGSWRHDLPHQLFAVYRPTLEWNRAYSPPPANVPADYVLLQEEIGAGVNLYNTETRKVRAGLSENLFDTWVTPTETHVSQNVESVFSEVEAKLPWRVTLTDRGVYYYSITDQSEGWENRFEVNKKLTETVTIGVRQEIRHNNPDVRSADYRRLRLLLGLDF